MKFLDEYNDNSKHFITRALFVLSIIGVFILHRILFINGNGKSCLGPPSLLPFMFIGFPLISLILIIDLLVLGFSKTFTWYKLLINFLIIAMMILFLLLIFS